MKIQLTSIMDELQSNSDVKLHGDVSKGKGRKLKVINIVEVCI